MFEGLFQPMHLLVILIIAMLIFGPKRLAELGKGLGDGIRSFKGAMKETQDSSATKPVSTVSSQASENQISTHS